MFTYALTNPGDSAVDAKSAQRDADFVNETGGSEDRALVLSIQRGIASGANEAFTFGHFEGAIGHFHRNLKAALGEPG